MPTYTFRNTETNEQFDLIMSISKLDEYLAENPTHKQIIGSTTIVHEPGTNLKVDDGFREVMSKIKEKYTVNNIKSY